MSRFVKEPDEAKAIDPMIVVQREIVGQIRFGNSVSQDIRSKLDGVDNKEIAAAIDRLAESNLKLAEALKALAPQKIELTKSITIKKSGNQEWKATVER